MEPIIKQKLDKFCEKMDLKNMQEGSAFERFVNYSILIGHQPDAFNGDSELFDTVNVGGGQDMGIDGIAIKVNGLLVRSLKETQDLIEKMRDIEAEFIFIQAKTSEHFDKGDFLKFTHGVKEFLSEKQMQPVGEKIKNLIEIKNYIMDEGLSRLSDNPIVRLYYVAMGKWCDDSQLTSVAEVLKKEIVGLNAYNETIINFIDSQQFKVILNSNENKFDVTIDTIKTMNLPATELVENSCVLLCTANEFNKILTSPDGLIRKSLFEDNVRDYQGDNSINKEIDRTIMDEPKKFALLNNGITIVCEKFNQTNDKVVIKNPQIVNGCQTSHVIFYNSKNEDNLSKAPVIIKLISTENEEITNQIVRSTNRQNIVYEEAFEATKPFHKELEEYINALSPKYEQFYYERRSKQYNNNPSIMNYQKINLRIITQSFVGMFLCEPHNSHRHETKLIEFYKNVIFQERQSKAPYFTTSLAFYKLEKYFRHNKLDKKYYAYKHHILMIFRDLIGGDIPDINREKAVEEYCDKILNILEDDTKTFEKYKDAIKVFDDTYNEWTTTLKRDKYGIKDVKEFTELLLKNIRKVAYKVVSINDDEYIHHGEIMIIRKDKYGKRFAFISHKPRDIFFHQEQSRSLDLSDSNIIGRTVTYKIIKDHSGQDMAKDVKLL